MESDDHLLGDWGTDSGCDIYSLPDIDSFDETVSLASYFDVSLLLLVLLERNRIGLWKLHFVVVLQVCLTNPNVLRLKLDFASLLPRQNWI